MMQENGLTFSGDRVEKIKALEKLGIEPYPAQAFEPTHSVADICQNYEKYLEREDDKVMIAGRIFSIRNMRKSVFMDVVDDGANIQVFFRRATIKDLDWQVIDLLDRGDFIGVQGNVFKTRTDELSIHGLRLKLLSKSVNPLPLPKQKGEKRFAAVTDKNYRYRNRHADLLTYPQSRNVFVQRAGIIKRIRRYLDDNGFIEVETPIVANAYSGAAARPFVTKLNAKNQSMYLRISPECALKRIQCGGFNRVYEIGKNFRNEGIDASHNPEFTMLEFYEAYSDYIGQMKRVETLVGQVCDAIHGTNQISYQGKFLDLTPPWPRLTMLDAVKQYADADLDQLEADQLPSVFQSCHPLGEKGLPEPLTWGAAVVELFEAVVEPHLWGPVFITDHPLECSPLTKRHRKDARLVERFEAYIAGMECVNAYSELNDPIEQYNRLINQEDAREERYDLDMDFVKAVADGMPQSGGTGIGIDRLVMILTGADSIRDVIFFPFCADQSHSD